MHTNDLSIVGQFLSPYLPTSEFLNRTKGADEKWLKGHLKTLRSRLKVIRGLIKDESTEQRPLNPRWKFLRKVELVHETCLGFALNEMIHFETERLRKKLEDDRKRFEAQFDTRVAAINEKEQKLRQIADNHVAKGLKIGELAYKKAELSDEDKAAIITEIAELLGDDS